MPITTTCPGCKALFRLPEELAGKQVRCQKCEQLFDVPLPTPDTEPIVATVMDPLPPQEEPILATVIGDAAPAADEPIVAPVVESSEPAPSKPKSPPLPVRPMSAAMILAMIALFLAAMVGTGTFAAVWVATHLSPPLSVTVVPPLHGNVNFNINGGFQGHRMQDGGFNFNAKPVPVLLPDPHQGQVDRIIIPVGGEPDERAITAKDSANLPGVGRYKLYLVELEADKTYVFDMKSDAITTQLFLFDPTNQPLAKTDGAKHSQIVYRPDAAGAYTVRAVSVTKAPGPYTLSIKSQP